MWRKHITFESLVFKYNNYELYLSPEISKKLYILEIKFYISLDYNGHKLKTTEYIKDLCELSNEALYEITF